MNGVDSESNARFSLIWRAIVFVLAGAFVWLAILRMLAVGVNPDEGFYLFCSRLVADGAFGMSFEARWNPDMS